MLETTLEDSNQGELLKEAQDAAEDGAQLTGQLLAFGQRQPLNPKPIDLVPLIPGGMNGDELVEAALAGSRTSKSCHVRPCRASRGPSGNGGRPVVEEAYMAPELAKKIREILRQ
jgi:hypothetical protein